MIFWRYSEKSNVGIFVSHLNDRFPTVKFSFEKEHKEQHPFSDVFIKTNKKKIKFDILRMKNGSSPYIHVFDEIDNFLDFSLFKFL